MRKLFAAMAAGRVRDLDELRRTADDLPGGPQPLAGKVAVDCDAHRLVVVAIGRPS